MVPAVLGLSVSLFTVVPSMEPVRASPLSIDGLANVGSTSGLTCVGPGLGISRESSSMTMNCWLLPPVADGADISTASCCMAGSSARGMSSSRPFTSRLWSDFLAAAATAPAAAIPPFGFFSPPSTSSRAVRLAAATFFWVRFRIQMKPMIARMMTTTTAPIAPPMIAPFEFELELSVEGEEVDGPPEFAGEDELPSVELALSAPLGLGAEVWPGSVGDDEGPEEEEEEAEEPAAAIAKGFEPFVAPSEVEMRM
ncbi:hypothetical protein ABW21_db0203486 [Orbilia brochopaga]|nr:hypothetical protein ABW21_db0203486 [Drechslerella brochopaga]